MMTMLRRLFWVALLGGGAYGGWAVWQRRSAADTSETPEWPPLDARPPAADTSAAPIAGSASTPTKEPAAAPPASSADTGRRWTEPADGACPDGFPIKANDNSGIYHVPGGRFYERTVPERCYANASDAEADGYRAAKS